MAHVAILDYTQAKVIIIEYNDELLEPHNGDIESWLAAEHGYKESQSHYMCMDKVSLEVIHLDE